MTEQEWPGQVRVVILLDDTEEGVIPVHVSRLAIRLNRMQVRLVVVCLSGHGGHSEKIQGTDTSVVALDGANTGSSWDAMTSVMRVREVLSRFKPDVLHAMGSQSRWVAPLAALGTQCCVLVRAQDEHVRSGWGRRLLRGWSDAAGRVSGRLIPTDSEDRTRRFSIFNGVDLELAEAIDSAAVRGCCAMELNDVGGDAFTVGAYIAEGAANGGVAVLDAFRIFAERNEASGLFVWGAGVTDRFLRRAEDHGLADQVRLMGDPHEPAELVRALRVIWVMGTCERSRAMALTALTLGVAVICSDRTDLAADIREVGGALMRDPSWPVQFAEATRDLSDQPELMEALQAAGPILMNQRHRFHDYAIQLREIYESLSANPIGSARGTGIGSRSLLTLT